jgi:DNA-binding NarL/FixJ family response regulator
MPDKLRVVLADDHPAILVGVRAVLASTPDIEVIGEVTEALNVQPACLELRPDVLILDLHMPKGPSAASTLAFLREHCPATKVLIFSAFCDAAYVQGMLKAGASGYVLKDEMPEVLATAIRAIAAGDTWFSQPVVQKMLSLDRGELRPLTSQEWHVLERIALGYDNAAIAADLGLALSTVRNYASAIYTKIGVSGRAGAATWYARHEEQRER